MLILRLLIQQYANVDTDTSTVDALINVDAVSMYGSNLQLAIMYLPLIVDLDICRNVQCHITIYLMEYARESYINKCSEYER